jgi:hypothetical protein
MPLSLDDLAVFVHVSKISFTSARLTVGLSGDGGGLLVVKLPSSRTLVAEDDILQPNPEIEWAAVVVASSRWSDLSALSYRQRRSSRHVVVSWETDTYMFGKIVYCCVATTLLRCHRSNNSATRDHILFKDAATVALQQSIDEQCTQTVRIYISWYTNRWYTAVHILQSATRLHTYWPVKAIINTFYILLLLMASHKHFIYRNAVCGSKLRSSEGPVFYCSIRIQ